MTHNYGAAVDVFAATELSVRISKMKFKIFKILCILMFALNLLYIVNMYFKSYETEFGIDYRLTSTIIKLCIQRAICIIFLLSLITAYSIEFKYSFIISIAYLVFSYLMTNIWFIRPDYETYEFIINHRILMINIEYFVVYPNKYVFIYTLFTIFVGLYIYKKQRSFSQIKKFEGIIRFANFLKSLLIKPLAIRIICYIFIIPVIITLCIWVLKPEYFH